MLALFLVCTKTCRTFAVITVITIKISDYAKFIH